MNSTPVEQESLKKTLDSLWSRELGFSIRNLKKGEAKVVLVDQQIEIPPRWSLMAVKLYGGCVVPVEHRMISEAEEAIEDKKS